LKVHFGVGIAGQQGDGNAREREIVARYANDVRGVLARSAGT
jgi:hypothetical protein